MLDTVALMLSCVEFEITDFDAFSPSARGIMQPQFCALGKHGRISCTQNPTKAELKAGTYKPRLTLITRRVTGGLSTTLRIEFSAPKLLFGNNFDELTENDFERVLDTLHRVLEGMGVMTNRDALRNAHVSAIHFGKNMALTDYCTCSMITSELCKTDVSGRLDLSKTDFRNEGHAIRFHANNFELTFYDKLKDLWQSHKSEKRALERDNAIQGDLFKSGAYPKELEVLRMEVRLGNHAKIKHVLTLLGIDMGTSFRTLFSATLSQSVLLHYWQKAIPDLPLLALSRAKPEDIVQAMIADSKGQIKPAKLLQHIGGLALIGSIGIRGAKVLFERQCNPRTWARIKKELDGLDAVANANIRYDAMRNVGKALKDFEPLRLKHLVRTVPKSAVRKDCAS